MSGHTPEQMLLRIENAAGILRLRLSEHGPNLMPEYPSSQFAKQIALDAVSLLDHFVTIENEATS